MQMCAYTQTFPSKSFSLNIGLFFPPTSKICLGDRTSGHQWLSVPDDQSKLLGK